MGIEICQKVKHFIWTVCRQCLPPAIALLGKKVAIDSKCSWCRIHDDDILHVLFECSIAKQAWEAAGFLCQVQRLPEDMSKRVLTSGPLEQRMMIVPLCWSL